MFINEEQIQAAFDVLHSQSHAKARAAYEYAEKRLKVAFAKARHEATGKTVGDRDDAAQMSEPYQAALKAFHLIAESYYSERDQRDAATAVIDAWRTQRSDERALRRVT
jgi:hypothetical protein